jgi:high-affinity Fe2+/Pb2+ permease
VPTSDLLGLYPTWETLLPQVVLLLVAAGVVWLSLHPRRSGSALAAA